MGVLPQGGRGPLPKRRLRHLEGHAGHADGSHLRLLHLLEEAPLLQVLVLQQELRPHHRREGDAQLLGAGEQVLPVVLQEVGAQDLLELAPLDDAHPWVQEEGVLLQLRPPHEDSHPQGEARRPADDDDVAVAAAIDFHGIDGNLVAGVEALADRAHERVEGGVVLVGGAQGLQHGDIDVLAAAAAVAVLHGGQDCRPGGDAGEVLRGLPAGAQRLLIRVAGDVH